MFQSARRTERLRQAQTRVEQAVGSRPGVRLANHLAMPTSATTLLRLEKAAPLPLQGTPRVLGVDAGRGTIPRTRGGEPVFNRSNLITSDYSPHTRG